MSGPRARANHCLYLARILLDAWRVQRERQDVPASTLLEAFLPATRAHLRDAYGWFLLEIAHLEEEVIAPPRCVSELPPIPAGRAEAGELRECRRLEREGWLAQLLTQGDALSGGVPAAGNLALAAPDAPGYTELETWHAALAALFSRMRDSLDEY